LTTLRDLGEEGLIAKILAHRPFGLESPGLVIGPGKDDAAAWAQVPGMTVVASIDTMVESVHFELSWLTPYEVGWRAVVMALGDLAAKGATPTYGLVALSAPPDLDVDAAVDIHRGMFDAAAGAGMVLAGGDTTSTPGPIVISVAVVGHTPGIPRPRSDAQAGWIVAVTGPLGGASAALDAARAGSTMPPGLESILRQPRPRLAEGAVLAECGLVGGDISDGLIQEMEKFRSMAGVGATLQADLIPIAQGASLAQALVSGEEVELVCVGSADLMARTQAFHPGLLTVVGKLTPDKQVRVLDHNGLEMAVKERGYRHFD
jgi:thiamine-monophosphate kinase